MDQSKVRRGISSIAVPAGTKGDVPVIDFSASALGGFTFPVRWSNRKACKREQ